MDHIEFDDGGQTPSYLGRDTSTPWMVRTVIKLSGNSLSEQAANYVLLTLGIVCLLLSFIILSVSF